MHKRISKREIKPGMVIDTRNLYVFGPYGYSYTAVDGFRVVRTELRIGRNVHGERTEQSLTCWNRDGFRITYYLHFEEDVTILNRPGRARDELVPTR